jgi:hypothetical protein
LSNRLVVNFDPARQSPVVDDDADVFDYFVILIEKNDVRRPCAYRREIGLVIGVSLLSARFLFDHATLLSGYF